jgi:STAS-like domain of unknown function (DUF4325)
VSRIEVKKELGSEVVTREHGRKLRELILREWENTPVIVDFDELRVNSVSFFDESFGQLALKYRKEELLKHVLFEGLDDFDSALVQDIISSRSREADRDPSRG